MPTNLHHQVNDIDTIVHGLSMLIRSDLSAMESERTHPQSDPDRMDDKIKHYKTRASRLRQLREDFENFMSEVY